MFKPQGFCPLCCKLEYNVLFNTVNIFELNIYLPGQQNNKNQNTQTRFSEALSSHCHLVLPCGYGYDIQI